MKHILRNKIAIVQGPPGTGKTFIGVMAVKLIHSILSQLSTEESKPILVICYTNHALDQFLELILPHIPKLIRIGGHSRSENLQLNDRNLRNIIFKSPRKHSAIGKIRYEMVCLEAEIGKIWTLMQYSHLRILKHCIPMEILHITFCSFPKSIHPVKCDTGFSLWKSNTEEQGAKKQLENQQKNAVKIESDNPYDALLEHVNMNEESIKEEILRKSELDKLKQKLKEEEPDVTNKDNGAQSTTDIIKQQDKALDESLKADRKKRKRKRTERKRTE